METLLMVLLLAGTVAKNYVEIIPQQLLCPLCISVIKSFKGQLGRNPNFEKELKATCESLSKWDEIRTTLCRTEFSEVEIETLKEKKAEEICFSQKLCASEELKEFSSNDHRGGPDFAVIPAIRKSINDPVPGEDVVKKLLNVASGKSKEVKGRDLKIHFELKFLSPSRNSTSDAKNTLR